MTNNWDAITEGEEPASKKQRAYLYSCLMTEEEWKAFVRRLSKEDARVLSEMLHRYWLKYEYQFSGPCTD